MRIILIAVLVWLAYVFVRRQLAARRTPRGGGGYRGKMVRCASCGVFLPETEARPGADGAPRCPVHAVSSGDR